MIKSKQELIDILLSIKDIHSDAKYKNTGLKYQQDAYPVVDGCYGCAYATCDYYADNSGINFAPSLMYLKRSYKYYIFGIEEDICIYAEKEGFPEPKSFSRHDLIDRIDTVIERLKWELEDEE